MFHRNFSDEDSPPPSPQKSYRNKKYNLQQKVLSNNLIRAKEVRVISETGEQLGVMNIFSAIDLAKSKGLDLIQVTQKVDPPVCKIGDYGKYLYNVQKKERAIKKPVGGELKEVRLTFGISPHDMGTRTKQAEKFLRDGNKIKVSLVLRGREKAMGKFAEEKAKAFIEKLHTLIPIKVEKPLKREPRGFTAIISKQ